MLNRIILLVFIMLPIACYSYSGDLPREFASFSKDKMVQIGECKDRSDCLENRRVLFSETSDGFHLTFYGLSDRKKIQTLITLLVDEYERKGVKIKMSLSFSKEKHTPNKGFLTLKQRKQPFIYFSIHQGA